MRDAFTSAELFRAYDTEEQKEQSQLVDVKLMISTDGGATWTAATTANFPAGGIDVVLPYPAGTNGDEYTFSVAHMVGTTANGMTAGDIEKPGTTNTSSGISTHFNGLSPVMITWTKNPLLQRMKRKHIPITMYGTPLKQQKKMTEK